jgi:type II secretion system (T2SS) protein G
MRRDSCSSEAPVKPGWYRIRPAIVFVAGVATGGLATQLGASFLRPEFPCLSSRAKAESDVRAIANALNAYAALNGGRFPSTLEPLVTPDVNGKTFFGTNKIPLDSWGRVYEYDPPGPELPRPRIRSFGRDGHAGGEGDDADIDNFSLGASR